MQSSMNSRRKLAATTSDSSSNKPSTRRLSLNKPATTSTSTSGFNYAAKKAAAVATNSRKALTNSASSKKLFNNNSTNNNLKLTSKKQQKILNEGKLKKSVLQNKHNANVVKKRHYEFKDNTSSLLGPPLPPPPLPPPPSFLSSTISAINGDNYNYTPALTQHDFLLQDAHIAQRLAQLHAQHQLITQLCQSSQTTNTTTTVSSIPKSTSNVQLPAQLLSDLAELESNQSKLAIVKFWLQKESADIEDQFRCEYKRAIQEYHDRRKELKETLQQEHLEARRQVEIDRNTLDINTDVAEVKPPPTRNLRRRFNPNTTANNSLTATTTTNSYNLFDFSFEIDSNPIQPSLPNCIITAQSSSSCGSGSAANGAGGVGMASGEVGQVISATTASSMLTASTSSSSSAIISNTTNTTTTAAVISSTSNSSGLISNFMVNKRKLAPTFLFAVNDDEVNEDHKCLLRTLHSTKVASSPKIHHDN